MFENSIECQKSSQMPRQRATSSQVSKSFESRIRMKSTLARSELDDIICRNRDFFDLKGNICNLNMPPKTVKSDCLPMFLETPAARRLRGAENAGPSQVLVDAGLVVILLQPETGKISL